MKGITKKQDKEAEAKIEALLPLVNEETPTNDPNYIELMRVSDIVEAYELEHYPIEKIKAMNKIVRDNPLRFKYTAQEIRELNRRRDIVVRSNGEELKTDVLLHPGKVLEMELKARRLSKSKFAKNISMYPSHMNDILKGKQNISEEIALRIEGILDISAEFWMRLQVEYNISIQRSKIQSTAKPINEIPSLTELLCKLTKDNIHSEIDNEDDELIAPSNVREANEILSKLEKTAFINSLKSKKKGGG